MKRQTPQKNYRISYVVAILLFALWTGCKKSDKEFTISQATNESSQVATDWYNLQLRMILNANPVTNVFLNYSHFSYIGVGLYEAVHPGIKGSANLSQFLYQMPAMPTIEGDKDYQWSVSANAALAQLTRQFFTWMTDANKASVDSLETAYNQRLRTGITDDVFNRSQAFGRAVGSTIFEWSKADNFNISNAGYTPPVGPGLWEPTPPAFAPAAAPYLKDARPFLESDIATPRCPCPAGLFRRPFFRILQGGERSVRCVESTYPGAKNHGAVVVGCWRGHGLYAFRAHPDAGN